ILEAACELHLLEAIADANAAGRALGLGAGLAVDQRPDVHRAAEIPAVVRGEVHARGVGQAALRARRLVAVLEVHARALRQPRSGTGDHVAPAAVQPVETALVLEPVVDVDGRAVGRLVARAELGARTELTVRGLRVDDESIGDAIGAAESDA